MSGNKMRVAMLSLALVGLLLLGHLAAPASAKNNIHVLGDVDGSGGSDDGRVVYADMKLAKTRSSGPSDAPVPAPAPAPGPSSD
ncbi:unnamed protein product [Urochloa decumbens]|uniref:Uncharacterized protein n=1 Tax=Urochloa decumbens TaxID=240449 RepID=A0ABC8VR15_9POAL